MTTTVERARDRRRRQLLGHVSGMWTATSRYVAVLALLIALFVIFAVTQHNFLTGANIENLLTGVSILW